MAAEHDQPKPGRPAIYTAELATAICTRLAEGESLRGICASDGMPARSTVARWVVEDTEGFSAQYARAREMQAELLIDEIVEIADEAEDRENAPAIKVRVDTRIWAAGRLRPKVYGPKVALEHTGSGGGPIETVVTYQLPDNGRDNGGDPAASGAAGSVSSQPG
jgi:hypothetical protein